MVTGETMNVQRRFISCTRIVMEKAHRFCHGFNSCAVESQHNKRTKYAPKRLSLSKSFANRSRTAVLDQNIRPDFKLDVCDVLGIVLDDERRNAIRRYEEARLAELAKKRSADAVQRTNTRAYIKKRQRTASETQSARAASASRKVHKASAPPASLVTVPPAPRVDNSTQTDDGDHDMYDTKYDA